MFGILPCICSLKSPREAPIMMVVSLQTPAMWRCVPLFTRSFASHQILATAAVLPECWPVFFLSLVSWQCQLERIVPDHTPVWQLYKWENRKITPLVVIKNSYSYICSLKWYKVLKMWNKYINNFCKFLKYGVGTKITFITISGRMPSQVILAHT